MVCAPVRRDNSRAKVRELSLRTGAQTVLHLCEIGLCASTVDNSRANARELSLHTGAQTMLYLSHIDIGLYISGYNASPSNTIYTSNEETTTTGRCQRR